jgi:hypothetical protein
MRLFIRKDLIAFTLSLFIFLLSIIAIIYSLFAGLWGFNPTDIDWFNTKFLITSIIVCIISSISTIITSKFT